MAYSPGPQSPGAGPAYMAARNRSASPPGASGMPSKRDKRRTALQERLHDLTATFSQNRDAQFRQQLHSLQCDMTLINNADPYQTGPLPDSAEDIARLIEETVGGGKFAKEMASLSGTWYSKFVQEINNVKEQKDADLAQIMVRPSFPSPNDAVFPGYSLVRCTDGGICVFKIEPAPEQPGKTPS